VPRAGCLFWPTKHNTVFCAIANIESNRTVLQSVEPTVRAGGKDLWLHMLRVREGSFRHTFQVPVILSGREIGKVLLRFLDELMCSHHLKGTVPLAITFAFASQEL